MKRSRAYLLVLAFGITIAIDLHAQDTKPSKEPSVSAEELPRIPPKSPEDARASIELASGFKIELVASEPLVLDPVAFNFDSRGRLFVVEMIDYSELDQAYLGRIALLTDQNNDGAMDHRSVFVDHLSWPTAVHPWRDGVLVIAPPKMTFFRDTNDDGVHDKVEEWYTGFGRTNVQGMANSLRWSVEGFLVGVTSSSGAELVSAIRPHEVHALRGRDFRIDPVTQTLTPISGGSQHGMAINRWGDRFATSNSDHLQQVIDLDEWLQSHPIGSLPITTRKSIAVDGPQAEVFRASPIEPWRIVRTRMRISGEAPGAIEGGGRAAGYFTGATGTWVMDAEMGFGVNGFDTAFACDVGSNLVHRKKLEPNGLFWKATRIDDQKEMIRSSDIWFRPVQLGDGPDGALYIADMYREVIEHPKSIPLSIKQHLDLNSGNDRGRIWRVKRIEASPSSDLEQPLSAMSNEALVAKLADPIAWQRRMASQLLVERQAHDVADVLNKLISSEVKPESKILALHLLSRLNSLDAGSLKIAMMDDSVYLNRHAVGLLHRHAGANKLLEDAAIFRHMLEQRDARLMLEIAMASSELSPEPRVWSLREIVKSLATSKADIAMLRSVIVAAAGDESWRLIEANPIWSDEEAQAYRQTWLPILIPHWTNQLSKKGPEAETLSETLQKFIHQDLSMDSRRCLMWLVGMKGLNSKNSLERFFAAWSPSDREATFQFVESKLETARSNADERRKHVELLRYASQATRDKWLETYVSTREVSDLPVRVIEECMLMAPESTAHHLITSFSGFSPKLQDTVVRSLATRVESAILLADAIEQKLILASQLGPSNRQLLERHPNAALRNRFGVLLASSRPSDAEVLNLVESYTQEANRIDAEDPEVLKRGQASFQRLCAACHKIGDLGNDVGPPLKSLHEKSPGQLVVSILDPNREVDPRFQAWVVLLDNGQVINGIIREESASQIVLAEANGKLATIQRDEIEQLKSSGVSLMPTGLQQQLKPQDAAELIAWLRQVR
jgi:putative membrane-bound dehydrogenase-like protein